MQQVPAPFVKLGDGYNTGSLYEAITKHPYMWGVNEERQSYAGSAHHSTETIFLRGPTKMDGNTYMSLGNAVDYEVPSDIFNAALPILQRIREELCVKSFGYILITSLLPYSHIDEHIDEGEYADYYNRVYIPIYSRPGNVFTCGGKEQVMKVGELWMFDHKLPHFVVNNSNDERIHLIVDIEY